MHSQNLLCFSIIRHRNKPGFPGCSSSYMTASFSIQSSPFLLYNHIKQMDFVFPVANEPLEVPTRLPRGSLSGTLAASCPELLQAGTSGLKS